MKNSDMKVVAIILSIALFFTIVTSNAVSIASVVFLAKDAATVQEGSANAGTATTPDAGTATTPDAGTATPDAGTATPDAGTATPDAGTATPDAGTATPDAGTATPDAGTATPEANKPAEDANKPAEDANKPAEDANKPAVDNNPIMKDPFAAYSKAANAIHTKGIAGYNKIGWQTPLKIEGLGILDSVIMPILEGFMTTEDEAEVKVNAKGSDDAKNRMPASNCSKKYIKSATAVKEGNNYKVTIVLVDFTNPSYGDPDGLQLMSREFLDYGDVQKEAANIAIVKSLEGQIVYKDYTITAIMTADGKFESITHRGIGYINATLNGSINAKGELEFNAKYTDFKY